MTWPRLQTQYSLHRTDTGRLSSGTDDSEMDKRRKQNQLQNIPKKIRGAIVPDPGYVMVGADWRAMQWCICMWEAAQLNDPPGYHQALLDKFMRKELDPHTFLAEHFGGKRRTAKSFTFGRMFLGSPRGLARAAGLPDKVGIKVCDAHDEAFKLRPWWQSVLGGMRTRRYIQSRGGWRRYWWGPIGGQGEFGLDIKVEHEALATLIQADEADICKYVLADLFASIEPEGPRAEALTTTHDSIIMQVEQGSEDFFAGFLKKTMEQPIPFFDGQSFPAEVQVGMSWKECS